jgi:hyperosmotically inducible protein
MRRVLSFLIVAALSAAPAAAQQNAPTVRTQAAEAILSYTQFSIFDDVRIAVENDAVTLTGWVTMPFKRDTIEERVRGVNGVRTVVNKIEVLPSSLSDTRLRRQVAQAIYTHASFWHYASMANPPIHIIVERGRVTLTGTVNSQTDRMLAFALAQVDGTLGVVNELEVEAR